MSGRGWGAAGVAEELHIPKLNHLQGFAALLGRIGVWAGLLGIGNCCVVHLGWAGGNRVDLPWWRSREGVRHHVVTHHFHHPSQLCGRAGHIINIIIIGVEPPHTGGLGSARRGSALRRNDCWESLHQPHIE